MDNPFEQQQYDPHTHSHTHTDVDVDDNANATTPLTHTDTHVVDVNPFEEKQYDPHTHSLAHTDANVTPSLPHTDTNATPSLTHNIIDTNPFEEQQYDPNTLTGNDTLTDNVTDNVTDNATTSLTHNVTDNVTDNATTPLTHNVTDDVITGALDESEQQDKEMPQDKKETQETLVDDVNPFEEQQYDPNTLTGNATTPLTHNVTVNVTDNVTEDVTGNDTLTGNVTGNDTGNVTTPLTHNVTDNVTGNVTGALDEMEQQYDLDPNTLVEETGNINVSGSGISGSTGEEEPSKLQQPIEEELVNQFEEQQYDPSTEAVVNKTELQPELELEPVVDDNDNDIPNVTSVPEDIKTTKQDLQDEQKQRVADSNLLEDQQLPHANDENPSVVSNRNTQESVTVNCDSNVVDTGDSSSINGSRSGGDEFDVDEVVENSQERRLPYSPFRTLSLEEKFRNSPRSAARPPRPRALSNDADSSTSGQVLRDDEEFSARFRMIQGASDDGDELSMRSGEFLTCRSDVTNPDLHQFLALMTCFPTLPVIGMFKNEMLPVATDRKEGDEDDEDISFSNSNDNNDSARDKLSNEGKEGVNESGHRSKWGEDDEEKEVDFDKEGSDDVQRNEAGTSIRRAHSNPTSLSNHINKVDGDDNNSVRSVESDASSRRMCFKGGYRRAQSFNSVNLESEASKKGLNAIREKEFEVARANAKRKRIKKKILQWLHDYNDNVNSNIHPIDEASQATLAALNAEYDEIYLKKDELVLELAKLKAAQRGANTESDATTERRLISERHPPDSEGHYFRRQNSEASGYDDEFTPPEMGVFDKQFSMDENEEAEFSSRYIKFKDNDDLRNDDAEDNYEGVICSNNDVSGESSSILEAVNEGGYKGKVERPGWLVSELDQWHNGDDGDDNAVSSVRSLSENENVNIEDSPINNDKEIERSSPDGKHRPGWLMSELDQWNSAPVSFPIDESVPKVLQNESNNASSERASQVARRKLEALNDPQQRIGLSNTGSQSADEEDLEAYLAKKKHVLQKLSEDSKNCAVDISDADIKEIQVMKAAELDNDIACEDERRVQSQLQASQNDLTSQEREQEAKEKVKILEDEKRGICAETKRLCDSQALVAKEEEELLGRLAELEKKKMALKQAMDETEARANIVGVSFEEQKAAAILLGTEEAKSNNEAMQRIAEKSAADEVYVKPPQPLESRPFSRPNNEYNANEDESIPLVRLNSEDTIENSVVEDDLMNEAEKEVFIEKRKQLIIHKEELDAKGKFNLQEAAAEKQAVRETTEMASEDSLSKKMEEGIQRDKALKDLYQSLLNQTLIDVMSGIEENRALELRAQDFEQDCNVLVQKQLKSRYHRQVMGMIRNEKSKNQSDLSTEQTKALWKLDEELTALTSRLMRSERNHRREVNAIKSKHHAELLDIEVKYENLVVESALGSAKQDLVIGVLDNCLTEKSNLLVIANKTIEGEANRTAEAIKTCLVEQAAQMEDYKHNLPAVGCQTGDDQELLAAHASIEQLGKDKETLNEQIDDLKYELESVQNELSETKTEFDNATAEYADAVATVRDHKDKSSYLSLKLSAANVEIERINDERVKISEELKLRSANQNSLEELSADNVARAEKLQNEVEELRTNDSAMKDKQCKAKLLIAKLKTELKDSQDKIKILKGESPHPQVDVDVDGAEDDEYDDFEYDDDNDNADADVNDDIKGGGDTSKSDDNYVDNFENEISTADVAALSPDRQSKADALTGVNGVRTLRNQRSSDGDESNKVNETTTDNSKKKKVQIAGPNSPRLEPLLPKIGNTSEKSALDKNGGRKQFGKLLHLPEKRKKKSSPDKHSKINKKYQKYREQQEQQQQRHDMVVKEVDSLGHTLPNNQSPNNTNPDNDVEGKDDPNVSIDNKSKGVVKNPQKGPKVSCSECGKRVSSSDAKKLPCVLKNLHNGKKVTADGILLYGDVDDDAAIKLLEENLQQNSKDDDWTVDVEGVTEDDCPSQSFLRSNLGNQFLFRDKYGHRRGSQCRFCTWDCARVWNSKHTTIQHRHTTSQLISIAEGKFV